MRIYRIDLVADLIDLPALLDEDRTMILATRLVRARNKSHAVHHIARTMMRVNVASQDDLVELLARPVHVERASEDPEATD